MPGSWAASTDERDAWTAFVQRLHGATLVRARYVTIDYRRHELAPTDTGPRIITGAEELAEPVYRFPGGHTVDYGVELDTESGQTWSVSWEPPGLVEGLAVYDGPLVPEVLEAGVAVWDVSGESPWAACLGDHIVAVEPEYEPWDAIGTWWCRRLHIRFPALVVHLFEAEGREDGSVEPSANNIVVQFE